MNNSYVTQNHIKW